jgi:protein-tyrosine phosphatase
MGQTKSSPISVLFVCTGNICRSPTAEAVFRHKVREAGLERHFTIDSAGTHGYHIGDPPDPRTIATALSHGVDMRDLRARQVQKADFTQFDHIFAMDSGHFTHLERFGGEGRLAMYLTDKAHIDLPDPYYGSQRDFDLVFRLVDEETDRLLQRLIVQYKLAKL